jgi:hypothetical protein
VWSYRLAYSRPVIMTSTTWLHPWHTTVHFPSLQPVSKTYYCKEQMLSWEAISLSVKKFHTLHEALRFITMNNITFTRTFSIITVQDNNHNASERVSFQNILNIFCTEVVKKVISEVILLFMWTYYQNLYATVHYHIF